VIPAALKGMVTASMMKAVKQREKEAAERRLTVDFATTHRMSMLQKMEQVASIVWSATRARAAMPLSQLVTLVSDRCVLAGPHLWAHT